MRSPRPFHIASSRIPRSASCPALGEHVDHLAVGADAASLRLAREARDGLPDHGLERSASGEPLRQIRRNVSSTSFTTIMPSGIACCT